MNAYDLLIEAAQKGNGRMLDPAQVIWVLQLIQNMDSALAEFHALSGDVGDIVDAEVIDGEEQVSDSEGQLSEEARVDSPSGLEDEATIHEVVAVSDDV